MCEVSQARMTIPSTDTRRCNLCRSKFYPVKTLKFERQIPEFATRRKNTNFTINDLIKLVSFNYMRKFGRVKLVYRLLGGIDQLFDFRESKWGRSNAP